MEFMGLEGWSLDQAEPPSILRAVFVVEEELWHRAKECEALP
jgi:hypothetical protein